MSGHEAKGGFGLSKWAWAHRSGLMLGSAGVMGVIGATLAYRRLYRGEDGLTAAERSALKNVHADFVGSIATKAGLAPQSIKVAELGRPMPTEGKVIVGVTGKATLADQASRSGGSIAAGVLVGQGESARWQAVDLDANTQLVDMGRNALNFEEVGVGIYTPPDASEVAIGLKWGVGDKSRFLPVTTSFKADGSSWEIAGEYPDLPIIQPTAPGSEA